MKTKDIFLSWDFIIPVLITFIIAIISPFNLKPEIFKDLFNVAITVSSIVFSVFFGGLATIISTSDNKFVKFIEEDNIFTDLIENFKFSLLIIFIGLIFAIFGYLIASLNLPFYFFENFMIKYFNYTTLVIFSFLFLYGIFATFTSVLHAITFFKKRSEFMNLTED